MLRNVLVAVGLVVLATSSLAAAERPTTRVLYIGIDGCRPDALCAVQATNLQGLAADGAATYSATILEPARRQSRNGQRPGLVQPALRGLARQARRHE
ncbi:MAG: hypothetical protein QM811_01870 [Pirellulales bacterium]